MAGRSLTGRLAGEVCLVTGSTSGLGAEIARLFAVEKASVVVTGRNEARGTAVTDAIGAAGGDAWFCAADLTEADSAQRLVDAVIGRYGSLTVLVNNAVSAAGVVDGAVTDVDAATWAAALQVNLVSAALLCRAAVPHMLRAGRGSIVNVSSRAAGRGTPNLAAYTASKGGLEALARSITVDFARRGIRCNTVQPGYILHERRDAGLTDERRRELEGMHLTRLATATDVAYAVLFLASGESACISGVTLPVDGGSTSVRARTIG